MGVSLDWVGEYSELQQANRPLEIVIAFALLLIMGILYAAILSLVNTLILMAQLPLACLGGVLALVVTGTPFSVSAAVGFISIFAIAIMDGILLNFYIHQLWKEGHSVVDSIVMGADQRFRAVMMTALVNGLGLLPAALSTRIGAQTQRPLAIVVIRRCDIHRITHAGFSTNTGLPTSSTTGSHRRRAARSPGIHVVTPASMQTGCRKRHRSVNGAPTLF